MLNFKPGFSLSSFTFIERLFTPSSFSAIRVVSSAYLRLLIFFLAVLLPACDSSSLAFHMLYSAWKLNKWSDNIQPCCTPFPVWNQSLVPCPVLTVASWSEYRLHDEMVGWYPWLNGHESEQLLYIVKDRETWYSPQVAKSQTWLDDWTSTT